MGSGAGSIGGIAVITVVVIIPILRDVGVSTCDGVFVIAVTIIAISIIRGYITTTGAWSCGFGGG